MLVVEHPAKAHRPQFRDYPLTEHASDMPKLTRRDPELKFLVKGFCILEPVTKGLMPLGVRVP